MLTVRQSFSGIHTVTKHVDEEGDAAVADVVVAPRDEAVPRRRVRRRGHLHALAAEKHTGTRTELSIELFEIANISSCRLCNISDYSDSTQKKSAQREKNERKRAWQEAVTGCQGRDTLVDLREHMPNATNVIQVADCNVRWLLFSVPIIHCSII